jgi:hypothetical protein
MGIEVVTPFKLAPSVGTLRVGVMASADPTFAIYDSPAPEKLICFGSLTFRPRSSARRSAFSSFYEGIDMALEDLCFHVSTVGTLRLPDPIHSAPGESTSSSTTLASPPAPSSAGSSNEPESTPTSIYCIILCFVILSLQPHGKRLETKLKQNMLSLPAHENKHFVLGSREQNTYACLHVRNTNMLVVFTNSKHNKHLLSLHTDRCSCPNSLELVK